jgi:hypothetical protein
MPQCSSWTVLGWCNRSLAPWAFRWHHGMGHPLSHGMMPCHRMSLLGGAIAMKANRQRHKQTFLGDSISFHSMIMPWTFQLLASPKSPAQAGVCLADSGSPGDGWIWKNQELGELSFPSSSRLLSPWSEYLCNCVCVLAGRLQFSLQAYQEVAGNDSS